MFNSMIFVFFLISLGLVAAELNKKGEELQGNKYYDTKYLNWQVEYNKFGAKVKQHLFRDYTQPHFKCAEFGGSSGYITNSFQCAEKVNIEINPAGREHSEKVLGLRTYKTLREAPVNYFDMVLSTSVLEHVNCPICQIKNIHNILVVGGVFVLTVPCMSESSMEFIHGDVNQEYQMFGALEAGNMLIAAGFELKFCKSERTQWPVNYVELFDKVGEEEFLRLSRVEGQNSKERLCSTYCVAYKRSS